MKRSDDFSGILQMLILSLSLYKCLFKVDLGESGNVRIGGHEGPTQNLRIDQLLGDSRSMSVRLEHRFSSILPRPDLKRQFHHRQLRDLGFRLAEPFETRLSDIELAFVRELTGIDNPLLR